MSRPLDGSFGRYNYIVSREPLAKFFFHKDLQAIQS